jgi:GrpB-like predicted nucleotidyltransferase (UPF0157 family)/RimJ/RimL family protein N-acetyltransferase
MVVILNLKELRINNFMETKRLTLKAPSLDDLDNLTLLRTTPEVMRYVGDGKIQTKEKIKELLKINIAYYQKHGIGLLCVFEKKDGEFVGLAGLLHDDFDDSKQDIELGYGLLPQFWNKGYATELVKALVVYGFSTLTLDKLIAVTHPDNVASQKVLKKSGFIDVGQMSWCSIESALGFEVYKSDAIELVAYDPSWPEQAKQEIKTLKNVLPEKLLQGIEHIGSTSISGVSAKAIIDIQAVTKDFNKLKPLAIEALKKLNYVFWDENPDAEHLFFVKGMPPYGDKRTHHVHIFNECSPKWKKKLIFRDYLRVHSEVANDYEKLKRNLATQHKYDRELYTQEKGEFVKNVLNKVVDT